MDLNEATAEVCDAVVDSFPYGRVTPSVFLLPYHIDFTEMFSTWNYLPTA